MDRTDLELRNREGTPVDPWPFVVVCGMGFLLAFSFGPGYLLSAGLDLAAALAVSALVFVGSVAVAYHRLVWRARPDLRGEIPAPVRLRRIVYWGVVVALLLFGLSLPFLTALF